MVGVINAYAQGVLTQTNLSNIAGTGDEEPNSRRQTSDSRNTAVDTVEISTEAQKLAQLWQTQNAALEAKVAYYQQFRPTHDGFSSFNISLGIVNPSAQPFSQNRSFAEVAQAARENLDRNYQKLEDIGKPYDYTYAKSEDVYSLFGEFDRRALYAVASNKGGLFTEKEMLMARSIMSGQQGMAMGLYSGPTALKGNFVGKLGDHEGSYKSGIQFMDRVSLEEKAADIEWAHQRATLQWSYEQIAQGKGKIPENFNIDHPLVNLLLSALESWENRPGATSDGDISSVEELRNEAWFEGYADRLDSAIAQTRALYGLAGS